MNGLAVSDRRDYNVSMTTITMHDIERDPAGYLRRVEKGEAFLVVRDDHAVAEIKPIVAQSSQPRPYGLVAGQFNVPDDFDAPLPDGVLRAFEGE